MRRHLAGALLVLAGLALGGCALADGMGRAENNDGATPGTVPGTLGAPDGTLPNGLLPEPWGDTS